MCDCMLPLCYVLPVYALMNFFYALCNKNKLFLWDKKSRIYLKEHKKIR